nr:immunoglobulin light chain junction region [Macaca mulatta]MOV77684.1 immunoglobulin light chain junction region [Macaca mulatta]MOV79551.1 immunoglobulin light chain junction region [Macaca mulatta]MOV80770.1 immunoglobulin light chain junction region [Macaca mulatta]MOV83521.1 immunoglobulin light chain junction region [Macaca mulatta]
CQQGNSIPLTF